MRTQRQSKFGAFSRNERGAVLIYVSIMLPVLIGFALLAVDASRVYNLQTQLQKAADALALAGAAELDRRPGAQARATNAINTLVANEQKFATGGVTITVASIRFLDSLPASDATAIAATHDSAAAPDGDLTARYVEIRLTPRTLNTILPATFIGAATNTLTTSATAVAGFTSVVCKLMPMFVCNPFEDLGPTYIFTAAARGRQIKMRQGAKGEQYFPGNFGYLDPQGVDYNGNGGGGTPKLVEAIASVAPQGCYEQNGVNQRTGDPQPAGSAINVRFDLWEPPLKNESKNAAYPPAPNVRRGYAPKAVGKSGSFDYCDATRDASPVYRLPRDTAYTGTYAHLGNGTWATSLSDYWNAAYGEAPPIGWAPSTRYDIYKYEIASKNSGGIGYVDIASPPPVNEKGRPMCYSGGGSTSNPDRRLLYAAIINCGALNVRGASGDPMPVLAFGRFFVTEPVPPGGDPDAGTVFAEFVDVIQPGTVNNDVARDQVQLFR